MKSNNGTFHIVSKVGDSYEVYRAEILAFIRGEICELPEDVADSFTVTVLTGWNDDGSNRGIVDWA